MIGARLFALIVALAGEPAATATANVVTDWDEIGVKTVQPIGLPLPIKPGLLFRAMAMMHLAVFNAVNAIQPRYQSYKFQSKAELGASEEAAAASAAANILAGIVPNADLRATLTSYLAALPDGDAKIAASNSAKRSPLGCWRCALTMGQTRRTPIGRSRSPAFTSQPR
jgi:hypothetical protein